jgi:mRNA interferase RelE/StbE
MKKWSGDLIWRIEYDVRLEKVLHHMDRTTEKRIRRFMAERVSSLVNPRTIGEALSGPLGDFWKYRVGDYRIICDIQDNTITILVIKIGNRREVYR